MQAHQLHQSGGKNTVVGSRHTRSRLVGGSPPTASTVTTRSSACEDGDGVFPGRWWEGDHSADGMKGSRTPTGKRSSHPCCSMNLVMVELIRGNVQEHLTTLQQGREDRGTMAGPRWWRSGSSMCWSREWIPATGDGA
jgi:hypothetical protein